MAARIWRRLCCWATGHDYAVASAQSRVFLRCRNCGRTSRGVDLVNNPIPRRADTSRAAVSAAAGHSQPAIR
jgi:hypothetical protein